MFRGTATSSAHLDGLVDDDTTVWQLVAPLLRAMANTDADGSSKHPPRLACATGAKLNCMACNGNICLDVRDIQVPSLRVLAGSCNILLMLRAGNLSCGYQCPGLLDSGTTDDCRGEPSDIPLRASQLQEPIVPGSHLGSMR